MNPDDYSLAVWKDCYHCAGKGYYPDRIETNRKYQCSACQGLGKRPTFVPLKDILLVIDKQGDAEVTMSPLTVTALQQWLAKKGKGG